MAKNVFIVNAHLLLHEKTYDKLRDFVKGIDLSELNPSIYHSIDYSAEDDTISFCLLDCNILSLDEKFDSGYIAMNFSTLKQFLSL